MADGSVTYLLDEEAASEVRRNDGPLLERLGDALELPVAVLVAGQHISALHEFSGPVAGRVRSSRSKSRSLAFCFRVW